MEPMIGLWVQPDYMCRRRSISSQPTSGPTQEICAVISSNRVSGQLQSIPPQILSHLFGSFTHQENSGHGQMC
ncbi:hypothetical protein SCLCIDRAFT_1218627 [Scleroderma citrinum Foug A]|uniref:Uncharacterized protein n=1 Tax=Scleroderma citrinum Foug A TaxID=1036808 RepID=A0A0C3A1F8_9AGAM|nr:hypothetical protein SCLCIDRAFT_1218627 [Scleroderma citrinum Foug A]